MPNKKLQLTVTVVYEADSKSYGTVDEQEMADIDQQNFEDDPEAFFWLLEAYDHTVEVIPLPQAEST